MKQQAEKGTTSQYTWLHITQPSRPLTQPAWPLVCTGHTTKTLPLQGSYCRIYSKISILLLTPKNICAKRIQLLLLQGRCHVIQDATSILLCSSYVSVRTAPLIHLLAHSLTQPLPWFAGRPYAMQCILPERHAAGCRLRLQTDSTA